MMTVIVRVMLLML